MKYDNLSKTNLAIGSQKMAHNKFKGCEWHIDLILPKWKRFGRDTFVKVTFLYEGGGMETSKNLVVIV